MVGFVGILLGYLGVYVFRVGLGRYVKMVRFFLMRIFSIYEILLYKNMYFRNNIYFYLIEIIISFLIFLNIYVYLVGKEILFLNSFYFFFFLFIDVNECFRNFCIYGGVCRNINGFYVCECLE